MKMKASILLLSLTLGSIAAKAQSTESINLNSSTMEQEQQGNRPLRDTTQGGFQKIEQAVVGGYKAIEKGVVDGYKVIENGAVEGYRKIEDKCVENLFGREGETVEQTKNRLKNFSPKSGKQN